MSPQQEIYTGLFENARKAARKHIDPGLINKILKSLASAAVAETRFLLQENAKDLDRMFNADPKYDRLKLTAARIENIAAEINNIARLAPFQGVLSILPLSVSPRRRHVKISPADFRID